MGQYRNGPSRADVAAAAAVIVDSRSEEVLPAKAQPAEVDVATLLHQHKQDRAEAADNAWLADVVMEIGL